MHILFELFYTVYPTALTIIIAPLNLFFLLFEPLFGMYTLYSLVSGFLTFTIFPTTGIIFIAQLIHAGIKNRLQLAQISLRRWWTVWMPIFLVATIIGAFTWAFSDSVLTLAIIETPYLMEIWLSLAVIGFGASCFYLIKVSLTFLFSRIKKLQRNPVATRGLLTLTVLLALFPFFLLGFILLEIYVSPYQNPQGSRFAVVHAAIKNTCFIDPLRDHCPQTLEEISYIEPQAYQDMMRGNQVRYMYDPATNLYSLVVRYSPVNAVVFDWRLMDETSIDLKEYRIELLGKDRLKNPPAWAGPWEFEEWVYQP